MSEISNTIKSGVNQFKDSLSNSKSFKKFKKRATKFGETGQFNVKDFKNLGEPLMKDFKKHGKGALLNTLKNLSTHLEGNRTKYKGVGLSGSGNKKDMSKGPNEKAPIDYRWIQAKGNTKKEVLSSSYNHYNWRDSFIPTEIESFDIIKPEPLTVDEGAGKIAGKIASKIIKSPSVKKFVGNLSKKSPVKVLGRSGTPKRAAYNPNLTLKPHEAPGAARGIVTKSQGATMKGGVKSTTWKSHSSMNRGSQGNAVKVYQQPTYAKPNKYPGDKTGAYARELARQDNTARIGVRSKIGKDGTTVDPYWPGTNTVGGKTKLKPARGLEDKTLEFLKKFKESYSWRNELGFDEGVAGAVLKVPGVKKTIAKVGGAVLAAKGGEKILKDLLGTPGKPKSTDWDKNPKDKIDQELNVRQGQAKDAAKNKDFDTDMKSYRKGKDNISDEDKIQRLKDAAKKHRKYKPKFNPRQNMTDKQVERMRKAGLL
tara:strand:+ start:168 stop:1613 length:1446 start_codon:yes stop_codon:yes gene_type:complete